MLRYVIRRLLQMIPTMFGVILITFVLFNISGGSPAVMKLGKQATPSALEEYETDRGLNKPLFWGRWGSTRAYTRPDFAMNPGPWGKVPGVLYTNVPFGRIVLVKNGEYSVPMALALKTNETFRWVMRYRSVGAGQGAASFVCPGAAETAVIEESASWRSFKQEFTSGPVETNLDFKIVTGGRDIEVRDLRLVRRMDDVLDSQFRLCLKQVLTLNFGVSKETNQRVSEMIKDGILPSLALTVPMFIISLLLEIIIALICAFYRNRFIDRFFVILSVTLMSVPYLVWIILGQYVFGYALRWFPVWGFESMRYLILPCMIGIFSGLGGGIRFYRTIMLDEMYRQRCK
jgi:peptide/nickel transport system permease protein